MQGDDDLRRILTSVKTIAVVGFSANPARPSHGVSQFLQRKGFRVVPVNPGLAGQTYLGETVYATLERDWFRPNRAVGDFNLPKR